MPSLYWTNNFLIRELFWHRLKFLAKNIPDEIDSFWSVLDLGCGNGAFIPTLANYFKKVSAVDKHIAETRQLIDQMKIENVFTIQSDILADNLLGKYSLIIAADVLEHIKKIEAAIKKIYNLLNVGGYLCVIIPSENYVYNFARFLFRIKKPLTHYHSPDVIEEQLLKIFGKYEKKKSFPLNIKQLSQFNFYIVKK